MTRRASNAITALGSCALALIALSSTDAHATLITFDDRSDAESVTTQYPDVAFSNATALTAGLSLNEFSFPPHSGDTAVFDDGGPLSLGFLSPVAEFGAFFTYTTPLTLAAFDASANLIGSVTSTFGSNTADGADAGSSPNEFIFLNFSTSTISTVTITGLLTGGSFVMDDATFASAPTPPTGVPEPATLILMLIALPMLALAGRRKNLRTRHGYPAAGVTLAGTLLVASVCTVEPVAAQSQGIQSISATPAGAFIDTPTTITFRAAIPPDPKLIVTSPNLQRLVGTTWSNLGRLYDDGTHGDSTAGDNIYSAQAAVNEAALGTLSFRASVAFQGQVLRAFSNAITVDIVPALGLTVESGSDLVSIGQGAEQNIASVITVSKQASGATTVTNSVSISPNNGGVSITSDYPGGGYLASGGGSTSFVLNQSFLGNAPGTYVVTNTATITGANPAITVSDTITLEVLPPGGNPLILPVGADPDGVVTATATQVSFTASITNFQTAPSSLSLRRVDGNTNPIVGTLHDDGAGADLQANDAVYSGTIAVNESAEGTVLFKASGFFPGVSGERFSDNFSLVITCFQTTLAPSDMTKAVVDLQTGESLLSNEVLVQFAAETTCARRTQIAAAIGGQILGTQPGLGIHQIVFPGNGTAQGVSSAIAILQGFAEVTAATRNSILAGDEVTPNDPEYGSQYAPKKMRADEAWVIARGSPVIAVLDTGVNYNHGDLAGKIIQGRDFINGDNDPMDDHGHGTFIAGIAAADSNNAVGISGISWNSKVLAIKSSNSANQGTTASGAAAIKKAADQGAKIINASWGGDADLPGLKSAVEYAAAKGAIVVATAGNAGMNKLRYPCAYPTVFCVGNTTSSDARAGDSNFGAHVDIAAPGSAIRSTTLNGGYGFGSGTSFAAPNVSGSIAVLWSYLPSFTAAQIRQRIENTAVPLAGLQLGKGRVDLFEAVFNGSFEDDVNGWSVTGTAGAFPNLGAIAATHRTRMGFVSSGPDNAQVQTTMEQKFTIQPDVTSFVIKFDYDFVTEEWPEFVGTAFNDNMRITLIKPDGTTADLAFESVNGSAFTAVGGINFPGGDSTVGHTGFKPVSMTVPVTAGPGVYRIVVRDEGDGIYDSNVLIDNIRFK